MDNLRKARIDMGYSQQEMADFLGISRVSYARYENGDRQPDNATLMRLADYFNVSTDYLLGRTPYKRPTDDPSLVWGYVTPTGRELTPEEQEEAKKFIDMMVRAHDAENQDK